MRSTWWRAFLLHAVVLGLTTATLGSVTQADEVTFKSSEYYCEKIPGARWTGSKCEIDVDPTGEECQHISRYARSAFSQDRELLRDAQNQFCGQRNIRELLSIAQQSRYEAMSAVSMGMDETQCDPARVQTTRCAQEWFATYHIHMCAAYLCKYGR
jgi:hypothetical protein